MFLVVHEDRPIYEMDFSGSERQVKEYFLIHSSLDNVDLILKSKKDYFLGPIKSDDLSLYAYVNSVRTNQLTQKLSLFWCSDRRKTSIRI